MSAEYSISFPVTGWMTGQESVPQVQWEGGVNGGDPGQKVFLESPDGAFRGVVSMSVKWHQSVSDIIDGEEII
jgi:hypothetical protein